MMATSLNYNRKRQRLLSNGSSASNTTRPHLIPKKQHFSDSINTEIINLDSDDDDYVFNNRLDEYHDYHGYRGYRDFHRDGGEDEEDDDVDVDVRSSNSSDVEFMRNDSNNHFYSHHNAYPVTGADADDADADMSAYSHLDGNPNDNDDIFADICDDHFGEFIDRTVPDKIDLDGEDDDNEDAETGNAGNDDNDNNSDVILQNFDYNDHYRHLKNFNPDSNMTDVYDLDDPAHHQSGNDDNFAEDDDDEEHYNDENENAIDDNTLDNGDSYTKYFRNNHTQKNTTRHLSFTSPLNNLVNRFLKKSNVSPPSATSTSVSASSSSVFVPSAIEKNKKRTKSLPQLAYAKMTYSPALDMDEISLKIGDVKASLINHYAASNYTYNQNNNKRYNNLRKFSFNQSLKSSTSSNPSFSSTSKSSATSSYDDKYLSQPKSDMQYVNLNNGHNANNLNNKGDGKTGSTIKEDEDQNCDDEDGYYIVKTGAPFANGRFIIKKLLGQGTFGKVVKAYDNQSNSYVAIKIIKSIRKYREASKIELRVLTMLKKHDPTNKFQCIHLRECFDYRNHICIVTDLLKVSLYDFMDKNQFLPFPGSHIQAMTKQLLRSVAFLHDLNLIHTDLKPENILIKDASYSKKPYHKSNDDETYFRKILKDPKIYTIDFGSAIFQDEYHSSIISTRHYRAPEIILGVGWSFPCDIWSVGCVLVELLTGDALFKTHENEQHLAMMEKVIGKPVDLKMVRQCLNLYRSENRNNYSNNRFDTTIVNAFSKRTGKLKFPKSTTDNKLVQEVEQLKSIEALVEEKVGFKFDLSMSVRDSLAHFKISSRSKDDYIFWYYYIDLIKKMLVFSPDERATAREALNHRWFKLGILDDGI